MVVRGTCDRVLPHDQRVLAVVRVVAAPQAARAETEALVEGDRLLVRDPNLERVAAPGVVGREVEQPLEQHRRDAAPALVRVDGDVHHVPGIDVAGDDQVADERAVLPFRLERTEADRARLRELAREHRARPRRRVRTALDLLDVEEVVERQSTQLDRRHRRFLSASGTRRYSGSSSSTEPGSPASAAWKRARGRCRSSSSGGTTAPRSSSRPR